MATVTKRKRIYVDRHVQGGIVLRLVALWVASIVLATVLWFVLQFFANPTEGFEFYLENTRMHVVPLVMAFAVTMPIAILQLLKFTHRFAGPVVRLRRMMRELADGEQVPTLKFREGDYWLDLADEFNRIATTITELRARVDQLEGRPNASFATEEEMAGV